MGIIKKHLYNQHQIDFAILFHYLSHPGRIKIIQVLMLNDNLPLNEITQQIGLCQSSVSCQMKKLKDFGLLDSVEVGNAVHYSLKRNEWRDMRNIIQAFLNEIDRVDDY